MTLTEPTRTKAPGAVAPLVREAWYVIGARSEFDRTLKQRTVLGEPLCYYEATDGSLIVLDDRCAHRRFPLSKSRLDGDVIQCGYHGFRYGKDGGCVGVPGGANPSAIRVRSYPALHRGPWVWIWTGSDPSSADPALIPWPGDQLAGRDEYITGYTWNPANYGLIHENLLDLTHLQYLHDVVDDVFTAAEPVMFSTDELPRGFADKAVGYYKNIDTVLGVHAPNVGADPALPIIKRAAYLSVTPALMYGFEHIDPHDPDATDLRSLAVLHCITPESESSTHQFWAYWQDVPLVIDPDTLTSFIKVVFEQDVEALEWQQEYVSRDHRPGVVEASVSADAPTLRIRRLLHRLAAEQS